MNTLESLSRDLAHAVAKASDAVVHVKSHNTVSGLKWYEDELVVTSARIALGRHSRRTGNEAELVVIDAEGTEYSAELLGADPRTDIAVLKVPGLKASAKTVFANPEQRVETGEIVLSLGRPGKVIRSAFGLASAVSNQEWQVPGGGRISWYVEVDGNLPEGFSGGPLINTSGQVLGMNTIAVPRGTGMTVPLADIARTIEVLKSGKGFQRYYLGINSVPVPQPQGLMITEIDPDSPAHKAGLLPGDIVQKIGDQELGHYGDLMHALESPSEEKGAGRTLSILRAGKNQEIQVELALR